MDARGLDYSVPVNPSRTSRAVFIVIAFLCIWTTGICIYLEVFNAMLGSPLPLAGSLSRPPKLSKHFVRDELAWREHRMRRTGDDTIRFRALTAPESAEMRKDLDTNTRWNSFCDRVSFYGLLQYPLCILGLAIAGFITFREGTSIATAKQYVLYGCMILFACAIGIAIFRGYLSAQGY